MKAAKTICIVLAVILVSSLCAAFALAAGDDIAGATPIEFDTTYTGDITDTNTKDYYSFSLPTSGRINIRLAAHIHITEFYIFDSQGRQIWSKRGCWDSSSKTYNLVEDIELTSGVYYFSVQQDDGTGNYEFSLSEYYTVGYDANGGEGAPTAQVKKQGRPLPLSDVKPERSGYNFLGWAESETATEAQYQPGASFTKDADTILYAVWEADNAPILSVESIMATPGSTVSVDVILSEPIEAIGAVFDQFWFFDQWVVLTDVEWKVDGAEVADWDASEKVETVVFSDNVTLSSTIMTLTFKIDQHASGDYIISFLPSFTFENEDGDVSEVRVQFQKGVIHVSSFTRGDVNGDGKVNISDVVRLAQYVKARGQGVEIQ